MADSPITGLPFDPTPAAADFLPTAKSPFGAGSSRKVALGDLGKAITSISANKIVAAQVLTGFTNTVGAALIGSTVNNFTLNWSYNRAPDPSAQSINHGIGAVANNLRSHSVVAAGITSNITYTINATGDDGTPSALSTGISFFNLRYFGPSQTLLVTDTQVKAALASEFCGGRAVTKTFDGSTGGGSNYLYYSYPTAFGLPPSTIFGGFPFSDYTTTTIVAFTNSAGFSENYYLLRTNNIYNSAGLVWTLN